MIQAGPAASIAARSHKRVSLTCIGGGEAINQAKLQARSNSNGAPDDSAETLKRGGPLGCRNLTGAPRGPGGAPGRLVARPHRGSARARGQPFNMSDPALQGWAAEWCTRCCLCGLTYIEDLRPAVAAGRRAVDKLHAKLRAKLRLL